MARVLLETFISMPQNERDAVMNFARRVAEATNRNAAEQENEALRNRIGGFLKHVSFACSQPAFRHVESLTYLRNVNVTQFASPRFKNVHKWIAQH